jgi:hypothetical protein
VNGPSVLADEQRRIVLTAHPLQRVGAFAVAALEEAGAASLSALRPDGFDAAVRRMAQDAVRASMVASTKAEDGFWLKTSNSFFPNAPMNHPSRGKKPVERLREDVLSWRTIPPSGLWPAAVCALCARQAVGFYGKTDIALAESVAYRNTTARGHAGLALCWPCVCCFHALPYGCGLTGGQSHLLHSWDDRFLERLVRRQVRHNQPFLVAGAAVPRSAPRHVKASRVIRAYTQRLNAGVELMVISNYNLEPLLQVHALDQPAAEWLRLTQRPERARGFRMLRRAHRNANDPDGFASLARTLFDRPEQMTAAAARWAASRVRDLRAVPADVALLREACFLYVTEVMGLNDEDVKQIDMLAANLAAWIARRDVSGDLTGFTRAAKSSQLLRALLKSWGRSWLLRPPDGSSGALCTQRQFELLADPDRPSWYYRDLLVIAVLEHLARAGWRPKDAAEMPVDDPQELTVSDEAEDLEDETL